MEGPMTGHVVYFVACGQYVKVGYSANVRHRMKTMQTANPLPLYLVMTMGYPDQATALDAETRWRNRLLECGKPANGEWVELEYDVIGSLVRAQQPIVLKHVSELVACEYSNADILEEALYGRCNLRARIGGEDAA